MFKSISGACVLSLALMAGPVLANDSQLASRASRDSAVAAGTLVALGVKVVAGVALRPVVRAVRDSQAIDRALQDSGQDVGQVTDDSAQNRDDGPLEVSPETVIAQPVPQVPYERQPDAPHKKDHN